MIARWLQAGGVQVLSLMLGALRINKRAALIFCAMLAGAALSASAAAQAVQPLPALKARITDLAGVLSAAEKVSLEQLSARIQAQRGSQIAVLLVSTTAAEPIQDYSNRVANAWKLGRSGVGDGVLIVAAIQDRKLHIEVARALEGALPDATVKRIQREVMTPAFKQTQYAAGLDAAIQRIDERLAVEQLPMPKADDMPSLAMIDFEGLLPFLIFGSVIAGILRGGVGGLGPVVVGAGVGAWVWFSGVAVLIAAVLAALVVVGGFVFSSLQTAQRVAGRGRYQGNDSIFTSDAGWGGGGANGASSGGNDGGFVSGGGGDFSGGGASGEW